MIISKIRTVMYNLYTSFTPWYLNTFFGMHIGKGTIISRRANLDRNVNPSGIYIGEYTCVTGALILTHDACRNMKVNTYVGDRCFLGANCIIMPGVKIGDEVIVGAGAVVTKDVPSNCIVVGNPAKIIRTGVKCGQYGELIDNTNEDNSI